MAALAEVRSTDHEAHDRDLVSAIRAHDDRAFEVLYARYQPRITVYICGMVQDDGRAEDITQDVFMSALRRMRETDREIVFKPWIYEIAKNACIDAFRRSRHTNEVSFDAQDALSGGDNGWLADTRAAPETAVDTKVELDNLRGAFGGLSDTHHQILVMRELEGLSYRDIGDQLGMSRPAVESTLFRARRRLEEEYDELASGKRCVRVRGIIDAGGRAPGVRDQRRMDRHISHCQPCRRHALVAGIDLEGRPARPSVAARIAAFVPLPVLWRRSGGEDAPAQVFGSHGQVAQWSANVASTVDPATLGGWGKAIVAAATVAVAGVGAGTAVTERETFGNFFSRTPAVTASSTPGAEAPSARDARSSPTRQGGKPLEPDPSIGTAAKRPGAEPNAPGAPQPGTAIGKAARPAPSPGQAADPVKDQPEAPGGTSGGSGGGAGSGGGVGGLVDQALGGAGAGADAGAAGAQSGAGGAGGPVSGLTSTLNGLGSQVGGALKAVAGQGTTSTSGATQNLAVPVASALDRALGGK